MLGASGNLFAQEDHLIENQRTNIIYNTEWGDTYLGKYTDGNGLYVTNPATLTSKGNAYVGFLPSASNNTAWVSTGVSSWIIDGSLQIGGTNNAGNTVTVQDRGTIEIEGLSILGAANGNTFTLGTNGTLYVKSDFNASMDGFIYEAENTLKVGGELSGLDNVEERRIVSLIGSNATWSFGGDLLTIGGLSDSNHVSFESGATVSVSNATLGAGGDYNSLAITGGSIFSVSNATLGAGGDFNSMTLSDNGTAFSVNNLAIGSLATMTNELVISTGARTHILDSLTIQGAGNSLQVTNGGWLEVEMDFDATMAGFELQNGGGLEAHRNLTLDAITNGVRVVLDGENALWDRGGLDLNIGSTFTNGGNSLVVENGARAQGNQLNFGTSSAGNSLDVTTDGEVRVGTLIVGSGNDVAMEHGGNLIIEGGGSILDGNLSVTKGGKLTFESDYDLGGDGTLYWQDGGILEAQGAAPIFNSMVVNGEYIEYGTLFLQRGQILVLNGSNATWNAAAHNLHIGDLSSGNALLVTNGANANVKSMTIGDFKEGGNDNLVLITGDGSEIRSFGDIEVGGRLLAGEWYNGGISNMITVGDGGTLTALGTLHNRNTTGTSGLDIKPGGVVDVQDYYQASGAYLNIYTDASGTNAGLLHATDTAEFEAGSKFGFDAIAALDLGKVYTNKIVEAGTLIVGGVTNATTANLGALEKTGGLLVNYELWEQDQDIYTYFIRRSIADVGGLDGMLADISKEIAWLASQGNAAASNQLVIIDNMGSAQELKLQMEQMYSYSLPTYMHNQGVFGGIDQVRARGTSFHGTADTSALPKPDGVAGPHAEDQGLHGWAKVYGSFGNRSEDDSSGFVDGYDAQAYGTVIGLDQAFGDWLFGIAGGFAGSTLDGDNGDESDATTGYGILYANYGTKDWFGDLALSYGLTDMDNTSGTDFDVTSSVEASQSMFYIGGGYQFEDEPSGALLRPLLGLQVSQFDQDAYAEESSNALAKDVDAYDRWSYQSTFGASLIFPKEGQKVDMELQLRTYWLHEFNGDEENVGYTLIDSGLPGQFVLRSPDQNIVQLGTGFVTNWKTGWQLRADIDVLLGGTYTSTTISGALLYEF